jgi:hypothetical protein
MLPLLARSTRLDAPLKPPRFATELLLRGAETEHLLHLLRAGSADTIVSSPDNAPAVTLTDALIDDPGSTAARHAPAASYYGETRSTTQSSARGFDGWRAHLTSDPPINRVVQHDFLNDESGRKPREGRRREALNDVTGRKMKAFPKSPCPPRARSSSTDSDDDALG